MKIARTSQLTNIKRTIDLDITMDMLLEWQAGALIQSVMPHLSNDEREFIMTGITAEEWETLGGDE